MAEVGPWQSKPITCPPSCTPHPAVTVRSLHAPRPRTRSGPDPTQAMSPSPLPACRIRHDPPSLGLTALTALSRTLRLVHVQKTTLCLYVFCTSHHARSTARLWLRTRLEFDTQFPPTTTPPTILGSSSSNPGNTYPSVNSSTSPHHHQFIACFIHPSLPIHPPKPNHPSIPPVHACTQSPSTKKEQKTPQKMLSVCSIKSSPVA